jgi:DUF971 family protein
MIIGYEVCFSWVKSREQCDRIIRTATKSVRLGYLLPATQYRVKVLARNDAGSGNYSEEYLQITNAGMSAVQWLVRVFRFWGSIPTQCC